MKNKYLSLFIFPIILPFLNGCANDNKGLVLYRQSNAYLEYESNVINYPLKTYHYVNEGNVPYVSLKELLPILKRVDKDYTDREPSFNYKKENGLYLINYRSDTSKEEINPFTIDIKNQTITINKSAKAFYHFYYDNDPNIDSMEHLYQSISNKNEDISLNDKRIIDLKKYDLKIIEKDNDLFAPIDLYQILFRLSFSPTGNNHIAYNGVDYFSSHGNSIVASCYSSSLKFDLQEPNLLLSVIYSQKAITTETTFSFSSAKTGDNEKYRFETEIIKGGDFVIRTTQEVVNIPDFILRISLYNDGTGKYIYIDKQNDKEFVKEELGLKDDKIVTYEEDEDYIKLDVAYPSLFGDELVHMSPSINKNETFYLEENRSKEYALYDFKITSLYLGEFYGLVNSNPLVRDTNYFLKPYKDKITSLNYHDYHLAMSEMALSGIDDGHTKVLGFSKFSKDEFSSKENTEALDKLTGPRRSGLLKYQTLAKAYRQNAGLEAGYEVVDDTAYLAFDEFAATPLQPLSQYTDEPNKYVESDTIGFAYKAMKDVNENHPEVKRVVFDLTCNSGGMVVALPFLLGLMKKEININVFNYYVDDLCKRYYQMDLNENGIYGEDEDTYEGKYDFYVLTSNMSFSCGNAFPGAAKYNNAAKIIGKQSAGGASGVDYFTTPSGFELRCSSCITEACLDDNGHYIENDQGIPVDYEISENIWYNRHLLNAELDKISK
ncbi:MAG: hypothetical protein J6Y42_02675 [Bacilli bacterium]|nr:hypothetical protein [Bacilli bacterium]